MIRDLYDRSIVAYKTDTRQTVNLHERIQLKNRTASAYASSVLLKFTLHGAIFVHVYYFCGGSFLEPFRGFQMILR